MFGKCYIKNVAKPDITNQKLYIADKKEMSFLAGIVFKPPPVQFYPKFDPVTRTYNITFDYEQVVIHIQAIPRHCDVKVKMRYHVASHRIDIK